MPVTPSIGLTATTFVPSGVVSAIISGRSATVTACPAEPVRAALVRTSWPASDRPPAAASTIVAVDRVERADERRHERGGREVVDLERRADLLDPALAHHDDPIGQRERLLLVVGHVDRRDPELALDRPDLVAQRDADLGVERRERLVEQQDLRLDRERPRQRDPLLLAARQLVRVAAALLGQVDDLEQLGDALLDRGPSGRLRTFRPKPMLSATVMFGNSA